MIHQQNSNGFNHNILTINSLLYIHMLTWQYEKSGDVASNFGGKCGGDRWNFVESAFHSGAVNYFRFSVHQVV